MPFLAPAVPYLINGGLALGSSLLGSKLAKSKPSPLEQQAIDQQTRGSDALFAQGQQGFARGNSLLDNAASTAQQPLNYWSSILSGNRGGITSILAPEINRISEGYKTAADTSAALMPRGGPRADVLANMPYAQQRDVSTLFQTARPQAAANLMQGANSLFSAGGGVLSNATNALYGSTSSGRTLLDYEQKRREQDRTTGAGLGKSIFDLLKGMNLGSLGKSGGGGGSGADPWKLGGAGV